MHFRFPSPATRRTGAPKSRFRTLRKCSRAPRSSSEAPKNAPSGPKSAPERLGAAEKRPQDAPGASRSRQKRIQHAIVECSRKHRKTRGKCYISSPLPATKTLHKRAGAAPAVFGAHFKALQSGPETPESAAERLGGTQNSCKTAPRAFRSASELPIRLVSCGFQLVFIGFIVFSHAFQKLRKTRGKCYISSPLPATKTLHKRAGAAPAAFGAPFKALQSASETFESAAERLGGSQKRPQTTPEGAPGSLGADQKSPQAAPSALEPQNASERFGVA